MQPLKVCFISPNGYHVLKSGNNAPFVGGAELQQSLIAKELLSRGFDISFITLDFGQGKFEQVGDIKIWGAYSSNEGFPIIRFIWPRLTGVWNAIAKADADIYYLRCAGYFLGVAVLWASMHKRKVVYCGATDNDFDPAKLNLASPKDEWMYLWGLNRCNAIVVQNNEQMVLLKKNFNRNARMIYNAFPSVNEPAKAELVLWVGNFKKQKQPELYLELAKHFPSEKFVMIGGKDPKDSAYFESLKTAATDIPNLEFKGYLPPEETEKYYARAKILVNTSSFEGFPNTFLQAWRRGVPVLSFVEPDKLVSRFQLGFIAASPEDMIQKLQQFLAGKVSIDNAAIIGCFESTFNFTKVGDEYQSLFNGLKENNDAR